jgi:hypothetical protein
MDDFSKYESMRDKGTSPKDVCLMAQTDGLDPITVIRLLRSVFSLSLVQAKEVMVVAERSASSLEKYQEKLALSLEDSLIQAEDGQIGNAVATGTDGNAHDRSKEVSGHQER